LVLVLVMSVAMGIPAGTARAQVNPLWDHYKVYLGLSPTVDLPQSQEVTLLDQFQQTTWFVRQLAHFANPVQKEHGGSIHPIHQPELHYTWWHSGRVPGPFATTVIALNQFGDRTIQVGTNAFGDSEYLLNPALKNAPTGTPLPVANHYRCYPCTGDPVNVPVILTDQFLTRTAMVLLPRFFCTPAEKRLADGTVYPIVDAAQHYTVYDMDFNNTPFTARISDQFITDHQLSLIFLDRWLMVPTRKELPTDTKSSTWGKVKSLYR
jgi:hypothetical protein